MPDDVTSQVRLLTGLTATELPDDAIGQWLGLNNQSPRLSAADALEAFASTLTDVTSDDITLSGSKRAGVLLSRAASLRSQAATLGESAEGFAFTVVPAEPPWRRGYRNRAPGYW